MTITYEDVRHALGQSSARWWVPAEEQGEVPVHALGRKIDGPSDTTEMIEKSDVIGYQI